MAAVKDTPIGLQLWSVREACAADFPGTLKAVKQMGYDGVEFAGFYDTDAETVKTLCADLGLKIAGAHVGLPLLEGEKLAETVAFHKALGNARLIVPSMPGDRVAGGIADWKAMAGTLGGIQKALAAEGLRTGFHNHDVEFKAVEGETPFDTLFANTDQDFILQLDMGWCFRAGVDAREIFATYPNRSETVHVKAYSASNDTATVGADDVPWPEVLEAAVTTGGTEWFVVEHERHDGDPLTNVKTCLDYLRGL